MPCRGHLAGGPTGQRSPGTAGWRVSIGAADGQGRGRPRRGDQRIVFLGVGEAIDPGAVGPLAGEEFGGELFRPGDRPGGSLQPLRGRRRERRARPPRSSSNRSRRGAPPGRRESRRGCGPRRSSAPATSARPRPADGRPPGRSGARPAGRRPSSCRRSGTAGGRSGRAPAAPALFCAASPGMKKNPPSSNFGSPAAGSSLKFWHRFTNPSASA